MRTHFTSTKRRRINGLSNMAQDVIQFTVKGSDKSKGAFKSASASIASVGSAVKKGALAFAGAGAAVFAFTTVVANAIDKQAKFATRLGVSVQELQALSFSAQLAGISTENFNLSAQRMTRRVAEATQGLGEAQGALKELGISAISFSKLPLAEQMEILADKFGKVKGESNKLRLAFKLFDSEGTAVLQMLKGGSDAMRAQAQEAKTLGLVLNDQAVAAATKFKDEMTRAQSAVKGMSNTIGGELMPILTGLLERFTGFMLESSGKWKKWTNNIIVGLVFVWDRFKQLASFLSLFVLLPALIFTALATELRLWGERIIRTLGAVGSGLADFAIWSKRKIKSIWTREDVGSFADEVGRGFKMAFENAGKEMDESEEKVRAKLQGFGDVVRGQMDLAFDFNFDGMVEKAEAAVNSIKVVAQVAAAGIAETGVVLNEFWESMKHAGEDFFSTEKLLYDAFAVGFMETMNMAITSISQGMATTILEGGKMTKVFRDITKQVLKQLLSMVIELGIRWAALQLANKIGARQTGLAEGKKAIALAGANGTASWAAAPWPINAGAPAFGAAMSATAAGFVSGIAGIAHGGLDNVPSESTFLLQKGERVLSPNQNSDLTSFLSGKGGGGGGGVNIANLEVVVLPNATNADALLSMSTDELAEIIAAPVIQALNTLDRQGIVPNFAERRTV